MPTNDKQEHKLKEKPPKPPKSTENGVKHGKNKQNTVLNRVL